MAREKGGEVKDIATVLLAVATMAFANLVDQLLWNWHIATLGLPVFGYWQTMGVTMAIACITGQLSLSLAVHRLNESNEDGSKDHMKPVITALVMWSLALLFGWLLS
jgi:hypothetical protein